MRSAHESADPAVPCSLRQLTCSAVICSSILNLSVSCSLRHLAVTAEPPKAPKVSHSPQKGQASHMEAGAPVGTDSWWNWLWGGPAASPQRTQLVCAHSIECIGCHHSSEKGLSHTDSGHCAALHTAHTDIFSPHCDLLPACAHSWAICLFTVKGGPIII